MPRTRFEIFLDGQRVAVGESYLTLREHEVVELYSKGMRRLEISVKLRCAPQTVDSHLHKAKIRIQARTIYELVAKVVVADALRKIQQTGDTTCNTASET